MTATAMRAADVVLALDQGTSSTRCLAFDAQGAVAAQDHAVRRQHQARPA